MNAGPIYIPWQNNAVLSAEVSLIGAAPANGSSIDDLTDGMPSVLLQLNAPTALIRLHFAAPVHLSSVCLIQHNLQAGLAVSLRAYGSPPATVDASPALEVPVTIRAREASGFRPNAWVDVDAVAPDASYADWAWAITGANGDNISVGQLVADTMRRQLATDFRVGATVTPLVENIRAVTYGGVAFKANKVPPRNLFEGEFLGRWSEVERLRDWFRATLGPAQNSILIPDPDGEDVHLVEFMSDSVTITYDASVRGDLYRFACGFRELNRGFCFERRFMDPGTVAVFANGVISAQLFCAFPSGTEVRGPENDSRMVSNTLRGGAASLPNRGGAIVVVDPDFGVYRVVILDGNFHVVLTIDDLDERLIGAAAAAGGFYVATYAYGDIRRYLPDGTLDQTWATGRVGLEILAVSPDGTRAFVGGADSIDPDRIDAYDLLTSSGPTPFVTEAGHEPQYGGMSATALGNGHVAVAWRADGGEGFVRVYNAAGETVSTILLGTTSQSFVLALTPGRTDSTLVIQWYDGDVMEATLFQEFAANGDLVEAGFSHLQGTGTLGNSWDDSFCCLVR